MKRLGGKCQRGLRRCIWVNGGTATTAQILEWSYPRGDGGDPRVRHNQRRAIRFAASKMAVKVGRSPSGKGRPVVWRLKKGEWD